MTRSETMLTLCRREDIRVDANDSYALLDSGNFLKLERYGKYLVERPEPMALWQPRLNADAWAKTDLAYKGKAGKGMWEKSTSAPEEWQVNLGGIVMEVRPWSFKHTGIFPEHQAHWSWILSNYKKSEQSAAPTLLNLFGYTGGASVAAAKAGFAVTHVDASKPSVAAAGDNARATFGGENPLRLIVDDAAGFVKRELRRGSTYDAVIMDPPSFGRGSKGQVWKIEEHLVGLLEDVIGLLSPQPKFLILNGYASGYSAETYVQVLLDTLNRKRPDLAKKMEAVYGEMALIESGTEGDGFARNLSAGIYARLSWSS